MIASADAGERAIMHLHNYHLVLNAYNNQNKDQDLSGGRCKRGRRTATLTTGGCPSCFPPFCSRTILYLWENRPACRDTELEIPCIPVLKLFWVIITQSESNLLSFWAYNRLIPPVTLEKRSILH